MNFAVIVPSKTISNVIPCVEAIHRNDPGHRLVIVDDGLDLKPWPFILDGAEIIQGQKPFIFSRAINQGCRRAIELDPDVEGFVLANDDAILRSPFGFTIMAQACQDYPEFGLIGATCNNVGNPNQHPKGIGLREEKRTVCFVTVYVARAAFESIGFMDEEEIFTSYGMDDDSVCLRMRRAGYKLGIHDDCHMEHGELTSTFRGPNGPGGDFRPNMKIFIAKYGVDNWGQPKERSQFADLFP